VKVNRFLYLNRLRLLEQFVVPLFLFATSGSSSQKDQHDERIDEIRRKSFSILVVDDEENYRQSLWFRLSRKYSASVDSVGSGMEAIDLVRQRKSYNLVFTDIMMPGLTGPDTFLELRRIDPDLRIVFMSGFSESDAEWQKAELLAKVFHKPIDDETLIKILSEL
jgi:CheY-like chemotaxis protein